MTRLILPPATDADVSTSFARDGLRQRRHRLLYRHWLTCSGSAPYPETSFATPEALPEEVVDFIEVISLSSDGDPVVEFAGAGIGEIVGMDLEGQRFSDMPGGEDPAARMRWCFRYGVPYLVDAEMAWRREEHSRFSALVLPFGGQDGTVDRLVVGLEFCNEASTPRQVSGDPDFPIVNADQHTPRLEQT